MLSVEWLLLLGGLGLFAFGMYLFVTIVFAGQADKGALSWMSDEGPKASKSGLINFSRPLVHNLALKHTSKIKSPNYRERVRKKLLTAGLSKELNVDEFIGLQILWGLMFPLFFILLNFGLQLGYSYFLAAGVVFFGLFYPHLYCSQCKKKRYNAIIIELPFFIDLMALSTEAGLDFINAIQRIVDKTEDSVLANELFVVLKDIKLGSSRTEALRGLIERLDMPEITSFCSVVIDADYTGASIASVLKEQSIQMRLERFVRAEKAGARASQAILIPMMLFILPAVFIMVFAPVALQFFSGGG